MTEQIERAAIKKIARRLLPFAFLLYFLSLIDRVNLSFAALTMNKDLGFTPYAYGVGAAIFFVGYIGFEIPSNLILERIGARIWISRIMISWGIVSAAMALIVGTKTFYVVRFLLGVAEAGLFPGMITYLTYWFPATYRARVNGALMLAIPVSGAIGAPVATSLLRLNGVWSLTGWQWLFILEGLPTVIVGFFVLKYLTDRPAHATWIAPEEKEWLETTLKRERDEIETVHRRFSLWRGLADPRVLALCAVYFGIGTTSYGTSYFLPQIIKGWGLSNSSVGWVAGFPPLISTIGMIIWVYWADRSGSRPTSLVAAFLLATLGLVLLGFFSTSGWSVIAMVMVAVGIDSARPLFWTLPPTFLSRVAAAGAIALISCFGNLGGIVGPVMIGWVKTVSNHFAGGLFFLAIWTLLAAAILIVIGARFARVDDGNRDVARV